MHSILKHIIAKKREEIARQKPFDYTLDRTSEGSRGDKFVNAIVHPKNGKIAIIAEIKLASPTAGDLGNKNEIGKKAKGYEDAGVDAISLVTEKHFFKGDTSFVSLVKKSVELPILQKDFVIDPYQINEAKYLGADALLLIAKIVSADELKEFVALCQRIGIEPVVEINDKKDLENALQTTTNIIAVNARDLETFHVDIGRACKLLEMISDTFIKLGFSGISSKEEIDQYKKAGANGLLVGTKLMKAKNSVEYIRSLFA